MSETKHTKGPWVIIPPRESDDDEGGFSYPGGVEDDDGYPVCEFGTLRGSSYMFWKPANARMIAASPDLLEALRIIGEWPITHPTENQDAANMAKVALDAVAKYEGRTP